MKITAVLPCHNHAKWVQDAINSIVNQTIAVDKIIIVDNGSTDNSKDKILDVFDSVENFKHPELSIFHGIIKGTPSTLLHTLQPLGPSKARNIGIKHSWNDSDAFALLDSDDTYEPTKIEKSVKLMQEDSNHIGIVYSDYENWNETTGLKIREFKEPFSKERLLGECIINCDSLINKKAFEKVGFFDENMRVAEDYDLWIRITEHFLAVHIPENLVTIRVGRHSSSSTVNKDTWIQCHNIIRQKLIERANAGR